MKKFEDRLMDAAVAQFFAPQMIQTSTWNAAIGQSEPTLTYTDSPAARVAQDIWRAKHDEILAAVKDALSVEAVADALAKRITDDVVTRMTAVSTWSSYDRDRDQMRSLVNQRIADELARRALAKLDAEDVADA